MEAVKISGRILAEIRVLKDNEKTLQRPFVFGGKIYDTRFMHHQLKRRRLQILNQFPELASQASLNFVISSEGALNRVENLPVEET
jgi:hypothetical protein